MASSPSRKKVKVAIDTTLTLAQPYPSLHHQQSSLITHSPSSSSTITTYSNPNPKLLAESSLETGVDISSMTEEEWPRHHCSQKDFKEHVVGWPPVRSFRKSVSPNQKYDDDNSYGQFEQEGDPPIIPENGVKIESPMFVKVHMDGIHYGRKVDLNAYSDYLGLYLALEDMFMISHSGFVGGKEKITISKNDHRFEINTHNKLSNFHTCVLTYEDKEGDWMMVGDLPWEMFVSTIKRLRIMKSSNGA